MKPRFLDLAEVLEIHADQIDRCGGLPGVRDLGLLQSAVAMPQTGFAGTYYYSATFAPTRRLTTRPTLGTALPC